MNGTRVWSVVVVSAAVAVAGIVAVVVVASQRDGAPPPEAAVVDQADTSPLQQAPAGAGTPALRLEPPGAPVAPEAAAPRLAPSGSSAPTTQLDFTPSRQVTRSTGEVSLQLIVTSNPIGPIEPLDFQLAITNSGEAKVQGLAPWADHTTVVVEFLAPGSSDWERLEVPRLNLSTQKVPIGGLPQLTLRAGETVTTDFSVVADPVRSYQQGQLYYYFSRLGAYLLRAAYTAAEGETLLSNEAGFVVEPYQGADAAAFEWLGERAIPHFVYDFEVYADNSSYHTTVEAGQVVDRFPLSRFAPWAKLYLAKAHAFGLRMSKSETLPPDLVRAAALAQELTDDGVRASEEDDDARQVAEQAAELLEEIARRQASQ